MSLVPEYGPCRDRTGHRRPPPRSLRPVFERAEPGWRHTAAGCAASGFIGESEPVSCLRRSRCCPAACPRLSARVIRLIPRRLNFVSVRSAGLTQSRPTVAPHIAAEAPLGDDEVRSEVGHLALRRGGLRLCFLRVVRLLRALSAGRR